VRVHLSAAGHPVIGDRLYGARRRGDGIARPLLHAVSLELPHPKDGKRIKITSPIPEDIAAFIRKPD
jgi:23S rRNA pseudouridine1911/1915/1917 synthase